jgi:hypothetical protein
MKLLFFLSFILCFYNIAAQSRMSLQLGWTVSKLQTIYDRNIVKGPVFYEAADMPALHAPYGGLEYEYDYKKLRLSTGVSVMTFGSNRMPFFGETSWPTHYWVIPIVGGYRTALSKQLAFIIEGGVDIGFQQGSSGLIGSGNYWGTINGILGVELEWQRWRLGTRLHWGLTNFRKLPPIIYKHTGITTYLGYTLWDHAQCKARLLKRQQEKQLE